MGCMKKGKLMSIFVLVSLVLLISFVSANIQTKNSRGLTTDSFFTTDEVFLKSNPGLCNEFYEEVDIYVVESGNTILVDVRGMSQTVNLTANYAIPSNTKIWDEPEMGDYDVIVDCDSSGAYHPLEPKTSFSVEFKKGSASFEIGKEIQNHTWQYDSEEADLVNEVIQLKLSSEGENVDLENITIQAFGDVDDSKIGALEIYIDGNNNGKLDEEEISIGNSQPAYTQDNGINVIDLDYTLIAGKDENILIVYQMNKNLSEGQLSLKVSSIYGKGIQSEEMIKLTGFEESTTTTIMPEKTCLGEVLLEFEPNPIDGGLNTMAKISGLTGCDNRTVKLRTNPCTFAIGDLESCVLENGSCELSLKLENKRYYVCLDKNDDGDMIDFGENVFEDLVVLEEIVIEETNETETNGTETNVTEIEDTNQTTVESILETLKQDLLQSSSILVLLEITLLLILFVLIVIAIRLRPVIKEKKGKKEKKEEEEEE